MTIRLILVLTALVLVPCGAAQAPRIGLGGGSDLRAGTVLRLTQGAKVPPVHFLFADNPETEPIRVRFVSEAPTGISVVPARRQATLAPGEKVEIRYSIAVSSALAPGRYSVGIQLVRADIVAKRGQVTNIPAVGTSLVVQVVGASASVRLDAVGEGTGTPVSGTLVLSAIQPDRSTLVLDRAVGSSLTTRVGPGEYEGSFLLGDEVRARKRVRVGAGESARIVLSVETVDFVVAAARPLLDGETLILVELVASVQNQLGPLEGPVQLRAHVFEDGRRLETVTLAERPLLPPEFTEARERYRPEAGWKAGSVYRFELELVTPGFTLVAAEKPTIELPAESSLPLPLPVLLGGAAALLAAAGAAAALARRRGARRRAVRSSATSHVPPKPLSVEAQEAGADGDTDRPPALDPELVAARAFEISQRPDAGSPEENWARAELELRGGS